MTPDPIFTATLFLKVWQAEQTCIFELSGEGRQLTAKVRWPDTLTTLHALWHKAYIDFYSQTSPLRARVEMSGTVAIPTVDWRAQLVQAEAELLARFHYWLSSAELLEIRKTIAAGGQPPVGQTSQSSRVSQVDLFLTCDSVALDRLPWEAWEISTEFAATRSIRIARTPANMRTTPIAQQRQGKMRVLAILGDDTGLNFQAERAAIQGLAPIVEAEFVGWRSGDPTTDLKMQICQAIADQRGWDVLFFAGHSNESAMTGGELMIAPNMSLFVSELAPYLTQAQNRGLKFALFNSCNGLSIAHSLVDLGLSQVAVMREPIPNRVAEEFFVRFLREIAAYHDVHDALLLTCQFFKVDKNLTYPSAYLIPSLFCHPEAKPFQLKPVGWKAQLRQWLPTRSQAIALALLLPLSWQVTLQEYLLERRVLTQAYYRQMTGQVTAETAAPPTLLVQIDDDSIQKRGISNPEKMDRAYLADLVDRLVSLKAEVIGLDYLFDRPQPQDARLNQSLQTAVQAHGTWFTLASRQNDAGQWFGALPTIAAPAWSLPGDIWSPGQHIRPLPWSPSRIPPFSYQLATAHQLSHRNAPPKLASPTPDLKNTGTLRDQVQTYVDRVGAPLVTDRMRLHPITAFSYNFVQRWFQPILDFSLPPQQVYRSMPAWQLLDNPTPFLQANRLSSLNQTIVIIAPGGYDEAGITSAGADNLHLPLATEFWRSQMTRSGHLDRRFTGGELHAYMIHHFLTQRLVIPVPDIWMVLIAAVVAKAGLLLLADRTLKSRWLLLLSVTAGYGLLCLQVYLSLAVLLPWLLPSVTVWAYCLPTLMRRDHVHR